MNEIDLTKVDFEKPFMAGLMDGMPGGFFVYRGMRPRRLFMPIRSFWIFSTAIHGMNSSS